MIVAPLSFLAHHVWRKPTCASWLVYSDGADVRLFFAQPRAAWQFCALEAIAQLVEATILINSRVTREQVNAYDFDNIELERLPLDDPRRRAPYANAHVHGQAIETQLAITLGVLGLSHARAIEGIREPLFSLAQVREVY